MSKSRPVALITGASAGIGRAFAEALADRGYDLVVVARDAARLEELGEMLKTKHSTSVEVLPADLTADEGLMLVEDRLKREDAPIDQAIEGIIQGIYFNQGHVCCAGSRLLVQEGIEKEIIARLKRRLAVLRVGDPLDKNTDVGAINSKEQLTKILSYLDLGKQEGAQVLIGGAQAKLGGDLGGGYYGFKYYLEAIQYNYWRNQCYRYKGSM